MRDAVIVEAVRTPVGRRNGSLSRQHAADLSAHVLDALTERTGLEPELVDDVVWGCAIPIGMQSGGIGRASVLAAGWPESVPAVTVERQCGSSQQAVHQAAAGVIAGQYDIAVAGGVEIMSAVPAQAALGDGSFGEPFGPSVLKRYNGVRFHQGVGAQMIADEYGLTRTDLDQHALDSHARAARAIDEGRFKNQIAPVEVLDEDGTTRLFDTDEGVRRGSTLEKLAALRPAFGEDGVITAGNASQISDGSAALLITTSEIAKQRGWRPLVRIHTAVVAGTDPITMLKGPIPATRRALAKAGLSIDDIGVFEINEAFAPVTLAWQRETGASYELMNPNGGAMAIGHPIGGSGARLMTTMVHHMVDHNIRYGLQSMCEGGGMANATILERL
ncbi:acetyl-CoA acetyltransferase [Rhodococcus sp. WB1]|uniref:thiolase family protein n=1 Tax=Rhodococcus TaxID=1827 RepID=UPI000622C851|nr:MULTISPECIES: thiolase family protein [Rhodococcus]AKE92297.1 acetyl-CoA acetyltransferase [Rhodococcus aetherivorans]ANZ28383.1 acetyl-CoA acetyltransferase [Rhodococcus sp. WB1]MBC2592261.1 thiolase family protein [Rhodococcus aetherivorans]QIX53052.1 thiolase family protein [Rhodococcus sp. DMU1]USC18003.1 thiolase family protein [Rhodococcus sp. 11-3]